MSLKKSVCIYVCILYLSMDVSFQIAVEIAMITSFKINHTFNFKRVKIRSFLFGHWLIVGITFSTICNFENQKNTSW